MEHPDTYSYYFGLGIAIILGYALSSLRVERLFVAALMLFPERTSGIPLKKEATLVGSNLVSAEETFSRPRVPSHWTEENVFELERRAIFSKACDIKH